MVRAAVWAALQAADEIVFQQPDQHAVNIHGRQAGGARKVNIKMTLTAPGCGMGEILVEDVRDKVERVPTVIEADVELVFDPPWNQSMMSDSARLETGMM